jgi:hypothetical protein
MITHHFRDSYEPGLSYRREGYESGLAAPFRLHPRQPEQQPEQQPAASASSDSQSDSQSNSQSDS